MMSLPPPPLMTSRTIDAALNDWPAAMIVVPLRAT